jgi:hypothetical protein
MIAIRPTLAVLALSLACAGPAFAYATNPLPESQASIEQADAQVDKISSNLANYIGEIDRAIAMAKAGGYGKLERGSEARLTAARKEIGDLLRNVSDPHELTPDKRIALFNAHQVIETVINKQDKNRVVCTRESKTGSRVGVTECLTVAEREERAKISAMSTRDQQRMTCSTGETSSCGR